MSKYVITGASGFVGNYILERILSTEPDAVITGIDVNSSYYRAGIGDPRFDAIAIDLLDYVKLDEIIANKKPDFIIHLASHSSVAFSWENPVDSFLNNTNIFLNLIEGVKKHNPSCRVLSVGSSEEYGAVAPEELPLKESQPLRPTSPYGVARVSQEMLSQVYARGYGLDLVITRSFNHVGPRQKDIFFIPSLVKQFAAAKADGAKKVMIKAGDMNIIRDFTDVRDVVRAYLMLLRHGRSGEIYNVCSGKGHPLGEIVTLLERVSGIGAEVVLDPSKIRPAENPAIVGDNEKLRRECEWCPEFDLETTLGQMLEYYSAI